MSIDELRVKVSNDLDIIINNRDFLKINVTDNDIIKVKNVINSDDFSLLEQCSCEMDDIINGIIIGIDEELNRLLNIEGVSLDTRKEVLNRLIDINSRLVYFKDNKKYFLGKIKAVYDKIDGDNL